MSIFRSFIICPIFIKVVFDGVGIFPVQFPFQRVEADVFSDAVQFGFVPDDVFVIIALPDGGAGVLRMRLIRRAVTDLKLPTMAPNDPDITPRGRRGEAFLDVCSLNCTDSSDGIVLVGDDGAFSECLAPTIQMMPCTWLGITTNSSNCT